MGREAFVPFADVSRSQIEAEVGGLLGKVRHGGAVAGDRWRGGGVVG